MAIRTLVPQTSSSFVPRGCRNTTDISVYCNISAALCDILQPCQNDGTCNNTNTTSLGFVCICPAGINGALCDLDDRPCQTHTCWNNGECAFSSSSLKCRYPFLLEARAMSQEIRHSPVDVRWSGRETSVRGKWTIARMSPVRTRVFADRWWAIIHANALVIVIRVVRCEITSRRTFLYQVAAKSLAYIGILSLTIVAVFIVTMDLLKYGFGIDPVREEREQLREQKARRRRRHVPVIQRFVYVNEQMPEMQETAVWKKEIAELGFSFVCMLFQTMRYSSM